jgi:hypothetical protein
MADLRKLGQGKTKDFSQRRRRPWAGGNDNAHIRRNIKKLYALRIYGRPRVVLWAVKKGGINTRGAARTRITAPARGYGAGEGL